MLKSSLVLRIPQTKLYLFCQCTTVCTENTMSNYQNKSPPIGAFEVKPLDKADFRETSGTGQTSENGEETVSRGVYQSVFVNNVSVDMNSTMGCIKRDDTKSKNSNEFKVSGVKHAAYSHSDKSDLYTSANFPLDKQAGTSETSGTLMMKLSVTGPPKIRDDKKRTVLPATLLEGVTDLVKKQVNSVNEAHSSIDCHNKNEFLTSNKPPDIIQEPTVFDLTCNEIGTDTNMLTLIGDNSDSVSSKKHVINNIESATKQEKGLTGADTEANGSKCLWQKSIKAKPNTKGYLVLESSLKNIKKNDELDSEIRTDVKKVLIDSNSKELNGPNVTEDVTRSSQAEGSTTVSAFKTKISNPKTYQTEACGREHQPEFKQSSDKAEVGFETFASELLNIDTSIIAKKSQAAVGEVFNLADLFSGELEKRRKRELKKQNKKAKQWNKYSKKKTKSGDVESGDGKKDEGEGEKVKKPVPNYFIAVQITDEKIKSELKAVQSRVISEEKKLAPAMNKLSTLHLTMMVLSLETSEDMEKSKQALDKAADKLLPVFPKALNLDMSGLGHFRNSVVFAKVKSEAQVSSLTHVAEVVEECFMEKEMISPDQRGFKPHITIMKLSSVKGLKKKGLKKIPEKLYCEFVDSDFGSESVSTLQLCSMHKPKDKHGYYQVEHKVQFTKTQDLDSGPLMSQESLDQQCEEIVHSRLENAPATDVITDGADEIKKDVNTVDSTLCSHKSYEYVKDGNKAQRNIKGCTRIDTTNENVVKTDVENKHADNETVAGTDKVDETGDEVHIEEGKSQTLESDTCSSTPTSVGNGNINKNPVT